MTDDFDPTVLDLDPQPGRWHAAIEPGLPVPGQIVDDFRIEGVLGSGGFAVVYRARHVRFDAPVALKLVRPSVIARRPDAVDSLCEEAYCVSRIHHRNVVRFHGVAHGPRATYVVMEHIDGPDLSVMLRHKGRLPAKMVLRIVRHVAAGLQAGLDQGVLHRDIKPSNVLLTPIGCTKIVDFGVARSFGGVSWGPAVFGGTIGYAAPEQVDTPAAADFRADLYALGVTAYQALTGVRPFSPDDRRRCVADQRAGRYLHPILLVPDLDERVSELIHWLLQPEPARRPRSYPRLIEICAHVERQLRH